MKAWIRWRSREEPRWVEATALSEGLAYLTSDELAELTRDLSAVVHRYGGRVQDPSLRPDGARAVRVVTSTSMRRPPEVEERAR